MTHIRPRVVCGLLVCAAAAGCGTTLQVPASSGGPSAGVASAPGLSLPTTAPVGTSQSQAPGYPTSPAQLSTAATGAPTSAGGPATTGAGRSTARPGGASATAAATAHASHTPVTIGFYVTKDLGAAFKSLGYSGLSTGDGAQEVRAVVKLVNSKGGLAGHPIKPLIVETSVSTSGTSSATSQQACSTWFEDHHATAVVTIEYSTVFGACAAQHQAPLLYASLSDSLSSGMLRAAPTTVVTDMPTTEVDAAALTDSLIKQGFFRGDGLASKPVIGLLTSDEPAYADAESIVERHLQAAGLSLKATFSMPAATESGDVAAAAAAGQAAALRFKAEGINHVIFVSGGFAASWFGVDARLQSYDPRLGWGSMEEPSLEPQVMGASQLQGAAGIGWDPTLDTIPRYQPTLGTNGAACTRALTRGGIDMTVAATRVVALPLCDATLLLAAGASPTTVTGPGLLAGIESLGTSYSSVMNFATDLSGRAATAGARPIAYNAGCGCFRYSGPVEPLQ